MGVHIAKLSPDTVAGVSICGSQMSLIEALGALSTCAAGDFLLGLCQRGIVAALRDFLDAGVV